MFRGLGILWLFSGIYHVRGYQVVEQYIQTVPGSFFCPPRQCTFTSGYNST